MAHEPNAEPVYEWTLYIDGDMQGGGWAGSPDELRQRAQQDVEATKKYPFAQGKDVTARLFVKYEIHIPN